ncbi:MAG: hypothetical protein IJI68_10750 [Eggerthellaceae bacterium]|nr:hypothetical protein [Eggerthellaceae bacterium]
MSENTLFITENSCKKTEGGFDIGLDDLVLTQDAATSAGSKMLAGFKSLFEARIVERLREAGYDIAGKVNIGEFGFDFLGESSYFGPVIDADGHLVTATAKLLGDSSVDAVVGLDVNGAQARAASLSGQVHLKPTYGCVSRFGTVAIACSGETVDITARSTKDVQQVLDVLAGHDDADGTSLPASECARLTTAGFAEAVGAGEAFAAPITHVKVARGLMNSADADTKQLMEAAIQTLSSEGIGVTDTASETDDLFAVANLAWNILMCAELCNNVNRFEGMKYGYHTEKYQTIDELYTKSRTEAFGYLTKVAILYGSEVLATGNYERCYDKALRIRRLVSEAFASEFAQGASAGNAAGQTAILLPACAKRAYSLADVEANPYLAFEENRFTAPAAITGLPALTAGGVQLVGPAFSDVALLRLADILTADCAGKEA